MINVDCRIDESVRVKKCVTLNLSDAEIKHEFNIRFGERFIFVKIESSPIGRCKVTNVRCIFYKCKSCGRIMRKQVSRIFYHKISTCYCHHKGRVNTKSRIKVKSLTFEDLVKMSKDVHGDKYEYIRDYYKDYFRRLVYKCKKCSHINDQSFNTHMSNGSGCSYCCKINQSIRQTIPDDIEFERAKKVHGDRYEYIEITLSDKKYKMIRYKCKLCGNIKTQNINSHLKGYGCKSCFNRIIMNK